MKPKSIYFVGHFIFELIIIIEMDFILSLLDLKLYKKIKVRERQAWEEEIKEKILEKQRRAFVEFIQEEESRTTRHHRHEKIGTQESPRKPEALVKIKVKYSSKGKENDEKDSPRQSRSKMQKSETAPGRECDFWMKDLFQSDLKHSKTLVDSLSKRDCIYRLKSETKEKTTDDRRKLEKKSSKDDVNTLLRDKSKDKAEKSEGRTPRPCKKLQTQKRPTSAPEVGQNGLHVRSKSMISDPGETGSTVTKFSVQYSQHKSCKNNFHSLTSLLYNIF